MGNIGYGCKERMKKMLIAKLNGQALTVINERVVSDSIKYLKVKFCFDSSWEGYAKTALFCAEGGTALGVTLLKGNNLYLGDDVCYVPQEVIKAPRFSLSVFGVKGESLITSEKIWVEVTQSGYELSDEPTEATADLWQQVIAAASHAEAVAESVRADADNGLFKGEKGDSLEVDMNYNSSSPNPQSGYAVAEALADKLTLYGNTVLEPIVFAEDVSFNQPVFFESGITAPSFFINGQPQADNEAVPKIYVDEALGDVSAALDRIISLQQEYIS